MTASVIVEPGWESTPLGQLVTLADFAATSGVALNSVQSYRSKGYLPEPIAIIAGVPVWTRDQMVGWRETRPGRGARTDLRT